MEGEPKLAADLVKECHIFGNVIGQCHAGVLLRDYSYRYCTGTDVQKPLQRAVAEAGSGSGPDPSHLQELLSTYLVHTGFSDRLSLLSLFVLNTHRYIAK